MGYHSIWSEKNKEEFSQKLYWNISVNEEDFEKQLLFLKNNGHTFIHFSDLNNPELAKISKPTVIFFDDGFRDVLVNARPILQKHGIPATIFITTGLVERTHFLWTLGVRSVLPESEAEQKIQELKKLGRIERKKREEKLNISRDPSSFNVFLNWDEVGELSRAGFEVSLHGKTHEKFTDLSPEELDEEFKDSKRILEERLGKNIQEVSYPYGRHNDTVLKYTQSLGFTLGMSTIRGANTVSYVRKNPLQIKRMNPEECETFTYFKVRLYTNI